MINDTYGYNEISDFLKNKDTLVQKISRKIVRGEVRYTLYFKNEVDYVLFKIKFL
jgi:hypothetical protein